MADRSRYCHIGKAGSACERGPPGQNGERPRQGGRAAGRDMAEADQDVDCGEVGVAAQLGGEATLGKGFDWEAESKRKKIVQQGSEPVSSLQKEAEYESSAAVRKQSKAAGKSKSEDHAKSLVGSFPPSLTPERKLQSLQREYDSLTLGQKTSPWGQRKKAELDGLRKSLTSKPPRRKPRPLSHGRP